METQIKFIDRKKQNKLIHSLPKYLRSKSKALESEFGPEKTQTVLSVATEVYPGIVSKIPDLRTPMYDALMSLAGKMAAMKKGMKAASIGTEEFVRFNIEQTRSAAQHIPGIFRKLGGKIYLSSLMRRYLNKVARSVTANGWPTYLVNGTKKDDYTMSIETPNCQMVAFWESIGEGDIRPYCTFFDFTSAELLGIGLKQVSSIDSGLCKYCFYKKGEVHWPEVVKNVLAG